MSHRLNYLYFGTFFALLLFLCATSIFTKESLGGSQIFFLLYAIGQIALEMMLLIIAPILLKKYIGKAAAFIFIGCTFFALFLHLFDFLMDRVLDLSVWEVLDVFVFQESLQNFALLLDASGVSLLIWLLFFALLVALPFLGMLIFQISDRFSAKRPIAISNSYFLQALFCVPIALLLWDLSASTAIHPDAYTAFRKSLPWKSTFLQPENAITTPPGRLKAPMEEGLVAKAIDQEKSTLEKRPNIYLFIGESLREDCITALVAPHLSQFKRDFVHFDRAASSANGTHISWFSIFHSQFPYHWKNCQTNWKMGSPALNLLKKWGYKIHLYSSAQLSYYGMETVLFGENAHLLDSKNTFHHAPPASAADSDAAALAKLQKDLEENPDWKEGQVFIVFWDCTHFDYSWPKNGSSKFTPFAPTLAFFKAIHSEKAIQEIKNRYFNAVHYMDDLFGSFAKNLREDAIVVFTGDHGEEFFDHGHLFHGSHLTKEQTHVPLYFKFGDGSKRIASQTMVSQMDIFPSIIDYLGGKTFDFLEGNSLFQKPKFPYAVTARFNGGCIPYEFAIQNGVHKMIVQFSNRHHIFDSKKLKIVSLRTHDDQSVDPSDIDDWVEEHFGPALNHLFQGFY